MRQGSYFVWADIASRSATGAHGMRSFHLSHGFVLFTFPERPSEFIYMRHRLPQLISALLLATVLFVANGWAQDKTPVRPHASVTVAMPKALSGARAYPRADFGNGVKLEYLGSFFSDGKFRRVSKFGHMMDVMITESVPYEPVTPSLLPPPELTADRSSEPVEEPKNFNALRSKQRFIHDFAPPAHAVEIVKGKHLFGQVYDTVASVLDGKENVMDGPHAVTTDSRGRIIITDTLSHSVHVLDQDEKKSFHIVGGQGRRIQMPIGVAVDAEDNIYVTDGRRGLVLVYDPDGRFLRYIGVVHGENYYQRPTGIAIDQKRNRVYLVDTGLHSLFILDMQGKVLARIGRRGGGRGKGEFSNPTAVAVQGDEVFVIDQYGARLQVLNPEGRFRGEFSLTEMDGKRAAVAPALCIDNNRRVYVGAFGNVRVYSDAGKLLAAFGRSGTRMGEFAGVSGLAVDSSGRMFIADSENARVQVFQLIESK